MFYITFLVTFANCLTFPPSPSKSSLILFRVGELFHVQSSGPEFPHLNRTLAPVRLCTGPDPATSPALLPSQSNIFKLVQLGPNFQCPATSSLPPRYVQTCYRPQGKLMFSTSVCQSVHSRPQCRSFTAHNCYSRSVHVLLEYFLVHYEAKKVGGWHST